MLVLSGVQLQAAFISKRKTAKCDIQPDHDSSSTGLGAGFTRVAHAFCWRSCFGGAANFHAFPTSLRNGFSCISICCSLDQFVKILGALNFVYALQMSKAYSLTRWPVDIWPPLSPRGCLEQPWKLSSQNLWWPSCSWCRGWNLTSTCNMIYIPYAPCISRYGISTHIWMMFKATVGFIFHGASGYSYPMWSGIPSLDGEAPALPCHARHESFHSSSKLKAAHLRGKGAWDDSWPKMVAKMVVLDGTFAYFYAFFPICLNMSDVFHGSIIQGQGPKARAKNQRLQRFGWSMDIGRSSRHMCWNPPLHDDMTQRCYCPKPLTCTLWLFNLGTWPIYRWFMMIYPFNPLYMVIFESHTLDFSKTRIFGRNDLGWYRIHQNTRTVWFGMVHPWTDRNFPRWHVACQRKSCKFSCRMFPAINLHFYPRFSNFSGIFLWRFSQFSTCSHMFPAFPWVLIIFPRFSHDFP